MLEKSIPLISILLSEMNFILTQHFSRTQIRYNISGSIDMLLKIVLSSIKEACVIAILVPLKEGKGKSYTIDLCFFLKIFIEDQK